MIERTAKRCRKCRYLKPIDEFYRDSSRADGHMNVCALCEKDRKCRGSGPKAHPEVRRAARMGLTVGRLRELLAEGCGVCGRMDKLVIDHDHKCCAVKSQSCGACVRGALCSEHNLALGKLGDDLGGVLKLVNYLERCSL